VRYVVVTCPPVPSPTDWGSDNLLQAVGYAGGLLGLGRDLVGAKVIDTHTMKVVWSTYVH